MAEKKTKKAETVQTNDSPEKVALIEGETRSGLKFRIDPRVREDTRLLYLMTTLEKESLETKIRTRALFDLLEVVFGSGEAFLTFQNEVAIRHNGVADTASLIEEITDIFEAVKLKN